MTLPRRLLFLVLPLTFGAAACVGVPDRDGHRDVRDRRDNLLGTRTALPGFDPTPSERDIRGWMGKLDTTDVLVFSQAKSDLARFPGNVALQIKQGHWPRTAQGQLAVIEVLAGAMGGVEDIKLLVRRSCRQVIEAGSAWGYSAADQRRCLRWYVETQPWENPQNSTDAGSVLARYFLTADRETRWEIARIVRQNPKGFPIEAVRVFVEALTSDSKALRADGHQLLLGLWATLTQSYPADDERRTSLQQVLWRINPYADEAGRVREIWSSRIEQHYPNLLRGYSAE